MFSFAIRRFEHEIVTSGRGRLSVGRASVRSNLTGEQQTFIFAALHFGDQNITAAVKPYNAASAAVHKEFVRIAKADVIRADFPSVIRAFDGYFPGTSYSIRSLFRDEQRRIVNVILQSTLSDVEGSLASIYENQSSLLHFSVRPGCLGRRPSRSRPHSPLMLVCAAACSVTRLTRCRCARISNWRRPTR